MALKYICDYCKQEIYPHKDVTTYVLNLNADGPKGCGDVTTGAVLHDCCRFPVTQEKLDRALRMLMGIDE